MRGELATPVAERSGEGQVRVRVERRPGRVANHVVEMAIEEQIDLLVIATHHRHGTSRLWHGSVSRAVLHLAPMSVASVPVPDSTIRPAAPIPVLRRVLVPTDFSTVGDRAVGAAYTMLSRGGVVHLLHAVPTVTCEICTARWVAPWPDERDTRRVALARQLRRLVPKEAEGRGIETQVEVVEGREAADAICEAAERLGVDLICLGSHGRSGLSRLVHGSVAEDVLRRTTRPVLVIPPPRHA